MYSTVWSTREVRTRLSCYETGTEFLKQLRPALQMTCFSPGNEYNALRFTGLISLYLKAKPKSLGLSWPNTKFLAGLKLVSRITCKACTGI